MVSFRLRVAVGFALCALMTGNGVLRSVGAANARSQASIDAYVGSTDTGGLWPVNTVTDTVGSPAQFEGGTWAIAVTPDGRTAFLAEGFDDVVIPVGLRHLTVGTPIDVGRGPVALAITPNGKKVFVANQFDDSITPIDAKTHVAGAPIPIGSRPNLLDMTPDGKTLFVAGNLTKTVTPINIKTGTVGSPIALGDSAAGMTMNPDGKTLYVSNADTNEIDTVDVATRKVGTPLAIRENDSPNALQVTPDGRTLVVADGTGNITLINLATRTAGTPVYASTGGDISITPDGKTVLVSSGENDAIRSLRIGDSAAGPFIKTGERSGPIAMTPDQAPVAALTAEVATHGSPTQFDASASTVKFGTIALYGWTFGDGSVALTATPTISHVYAHAGSYAVSVTEADSAGTSTRVVYTGRAVLRHGRASAKASQTIVIP